MVSGESEGEDEVMCLHVAFEILNGLPIVKTAEKSDVPMSTETQGLSY